MKQRIQVLALALTVLTWLPGSRAGGDTGAPPPGWAGDAACSVCHDDAAAKLGAHRLFLEPRGRAGAAVHCESCHGAGAAHAEDPDAHPMAKLAQQPAMQSNRACFACHALPLEEGAAQHQHARAGLRCTECHAAHGGEQPKLLREAPIETCLRCHAEVGGDLRQVSHHPMRDGRMTCATCHVGAPEAAGAAAPRGTSVLCLACHAEHDPLASFEHVPLNEMALEGEGCTACHDPHGSAHARLLRRPGDALCLQCHSVPSHATAHGGAYAGIRCMECHVDVHGSFTNRALLVARPLGQDCLVCHGR